MFKKFAKDAFNDPLTLTQYTLWTSSFLPTMTLDQYRSLVVDISMLSYQSLLSKAHIKARAEQDVDGISTNGLLAITDFVYCAEYMSSWQNQWLLTLGWNTNTTGYDINTVSFSSAELMEAGIEWLRMQIKLSCRMLEFMST